MGIPSYFSTIIKEYPHIIKKLLQNTLTTDNFFLDSNSIVYDCARTIDFSLDTTTTPQEQVIVAVLKKIEEYISIVNPKNLIMISLDGTPPVAKLEQQRQRRYKSWYTSKMTSNDNLNQKPNDRTFHTIEITTGTQFMSQLNNALRSHFNNPSTYGVNHFIVSTSDEAGEGESKIYEYMRSSKNVKKEHVSLIYGLDADLIMLSINNLCHFPYLYLFRETPEFIKSVDSSLEPNENYVLDIPGLSENITSYMNNGKPDKVNRTHDYIFLCFLLGNDFLPHFPAINIRTDGIDKLLNAYKQHLGGTKELLIKNNSIQWKNLRKILMTIASREEEYLIDEVKKRDKYEFRNYPETTPEEIFLKFNALPTYERGCEKYIDPSNKGWRERYYNELLDVEIDDVRVHQISNNYLEGLEWTFKYYTTGCPDWLWCYKYHYPPLVDDLIKHIPYFETQYISPNNHQAVSQILQLCYVLPKHSLSLLPEKLCKALQENFPDWYTDEANFNWAFCKYFWEGHAKLPLININELSLFLDRNKATYVTA